MAKAHRLPQSLGPAAAGPDPLILSLSKDERGRHVLQECSWFDKLTMNGVSIPLILSLSKDERGRHVVQSRSWFDGLTMSGWAR